MSGPWSNEPRPAFCRGLCIEPFSAALPGLRFDATRGGQHSAGLSSPVTSSLSSRTGALAASGAFFIWGIVPIYWKQMHGVAAIELIAHRIVWSLLFLLVVVAWQKNFASLGPACRACAPSGLNLLASLLLAANWTVYVWAVNSGHVIEGSLGYFLVPLLSVLVGALVLQEKLRKPQWAAIGLAAGGVALLLFRVGHVPWIALALAVTWTSYGFLKKSPGWGRWPA